MIGVLLSTDFFFEDDLWDPRLERILKFLILGFLILGFLILGFLILGFLILGILILDFLTLSLFLPESLSLTLILFDTVLTFSLSTLTFKFLRFAFKFGIAISEFPKS